MASDPFGSAVRADVAIGTMLIGTGFSNFVTDQTKSSLFQLLADFNPLVCRPSSMSLKSFKATARIPVSSILC